MKALGLVVSEKKIVLCFSHCKSMGANDPQGGAIFDHGGMVGRIYKEDHYTLLHTKYENSGPCGFREDFLCFSHFKCIGANDPRGGAIFYPRGMVGRIYIEDDYTLLHTEYESSGPCNFGDEDFFYVFPMTPRGGACMDPRGTFGRIYKEDHYTLLHKKYEFSVPCGFREEDFFLCFSHYKSMGAICCHGNQSSDPTLPKT